MDSICNREAIGLQIKNTNSIIKRSFDASPVTKKVQNMTGTNAWLIAFVAERTEAGKDVYQKDLEESFGVTRSSVSKVLTLMEKKGLIQRQSVANDARLKKLVLTEKAQEMALEMRTNAEHMEKKIAKGFKKEELEMLADYLIRIQKNLEPGKEDTEE